MPTWYSKITTVGLARLAQAEMSGSKFQFHEIAVGDGAGSSVTPDVSMTALIREVWRGSVNNVEIAASDPNTIRIEGLVPSSSGGFTMREIGVFNTSGELVVIANMPATYKPTPDEGVTSDAYVRVLIEYANPDTIALTTDPDVVTASREYVDRSTAARLSLWENFR